MTAIDVSAHAIDVARRNAELNGARVRWVLSDMWSEVDGRFDVVVCNPPYIPTADIAALDREVREHEPIAALDGGEDGLKFYRELAEGLPAHLNEGGILLAEIGAQQADDVRRIFAPAGEVKIFKDIEGKDRIAAVTLCGRN